MRRDITVALFIFGLTPACLSQESPKKGVPAECTKTIRVHGSFPKGPFKTLPNESYRQSPKVKYVIQENGTVSNVTITRSSGLADMDKKILDAIARWKYKPRPAGCGVIETEMIAIIHLE